MTPYELEAWAFSLDLEERPEAFLVVADAFEMAGEFDAAEIRRSWADQMHHAPVQAKDPKPHLIGFFYSLEDGQTHLTDNGVYRNNPQLVGWSYGLTFMPKSFPRPSQPWYHRKGHWNKRKALMKMPLEMLIRRNKV